MISLTFIWMTKVWWWYTFSKTVSYLYLDLTNVKPIDRLLGDDLVIWSRSSGNSLVGENAALPAMSHLLKFASPGITLYKLVKKGFFTYHHWNLFPLLLLRCKKIWKFHGVKVALILVYTFFSGAFQNSILNIQIQYFRLFQWKLCITLRINTQYSSSKITDILCIFPK